MTDEHEWQVDPDRRWARIAGGSGWQVDLDGRAGGTGWLVGIDGSRAEMAGKLGWEVAADPGSR